MTNSNFVGCSIGRSARGRDSPPGMDFLYSRALSSTAAPSLFLWRDQAQPLPSLGRAEVREGMDTMASAPAPLPPVPVSDKRCPNRVEVDPAEQLISAAVVREWLNHLRSHGWTEKDLSVAWLARARQGVER